MSSDEIESVVNMALIQSHISPASNNNQQAEREESDDNDSSVVDQIESTTNSKLPPEKKRKMQTQNFKCQMTHIFGPQKV